MGSYEIQFPDLQTVLLKNQMIRVRDGIHLAADVYLPDEELKKKNNWNRLPAVMEYIPYRKDEAVPGKRFSEVLARKGYAVVRVDIRGTGSSEGINQDEYTVREQWDGYDAVEWIASQPWCDGQVNIMGISYGGFTALQIAGLQPPHLRTIIPVDFTDNRYTDDCVYCGGLLRMYYNVALYGTQMVAYNAMPPSTLLDENQYAAIWKTHLENNTPYFLNWFQNPLENSYWENGSASAFTEKIQCPVFLIGGWRDGYPNPPFRLFQKLKSPKKIWVGPWNHAWPEKAIPGPRVDYLEEVCRWLDYWCKEISTGIMDEPAIHFFVQSFQKPDPDCLDSAGYWRAERIYPFDALESKKVFLTFDHCLAEKKIDDTAACNLEYYPQTGVRTGLWSGGIMFGLPDDHRKDEAYSQVFDSPVYEENSIIFGRPEFSCTVSSDVPVVGLCVCLSEVAPNGTSALITKGILNLARDHTFSEIKILEKYEKRKVQIFLDHTAWQISKGNKIRLSLSSGDFPNIWPTPYPAKTSISIGGTDAAVFSLPILHSVSKESVRQFKPSAKIINSHTENPDTPVWEIKEDLLRQTTAVRIAQKSEFRSNENIDYTHDQDSSFTVSQKNPADAVATGTCVCVQKKAETEIKAKSMVSIRSDNQNFHLYITLEVYNADRIIFTKKWTERYSRAGM